MANYADLLNVMYLYSHSLRGSTVLPTTLWVRHHGFIQSRPYFITSGCYCAALLLPLRILLHWIFWLRLLIN